jgi:hypothetical protein
MGQDNRLMGAPVQTIQARKVPRIVSDVLVYVSAKDGVSRIWAKPGDDLSDMKESDLADARKRGIVVDVLEEV